MSNKEYEALRELAKAARESAAANNGSHLAAAADVLDALSKGQLQSAYKALWKIGPMTREVDVDCRDCGGRGCFECDYCGYVRKSVSV